MPCRELRFVLSVVFYVVNENLQNRIRSKSCKKQKKTLPLISIFSLIKGEKGHEVFEMRMYGGRGVLNSYHHN